MMFRRRLAGACMAVVSAGGCAGVPAYEVTPEQFQAVYDAPRSVMMPHGVYAGLRDEQHRMYVYALGADSFPLHRYTLVTPSGAMPRGFPDRPPGPSVSWPLTEAEATEYHRAWQGVPAGPRQSGSSF